MWLKKWFLQPDPDGTCSNVVSLFVKGYTGLAEAIENWDFSKLEKLELHRELLKRIEATMLEADPVMLMPYINTCLIERECDEILQVCLIALFCCGVHQAAKEESSQP